MNVRMIREAVGVLSLALSDRDVTACSCASRDSPPPLRPSSLKMRPPARTGPLPVPNIVRRGCDLRCELRRDLLRQPG